MTEEVIQLKDLPPHEVPADLRAETYFDFGAHAFDHEELFSSANSVYGAILGIDSWHVE